MVKSALMTRLEWRDRHHRVLHIGGTPANALKVREALREAASQSYDIEWAETLVAGLKRLSLNQQLSAVLLDLDLPDSLDSDGLAAVLAASPTLPVLVVGRDENQDTARRVTRAGAFEYLVTRHLDNYWLPRALNHAVDWKWSEAALSDEAERVGNTLNSMGDALLSTDPSGRVTFMNSTAETMTGWTRIEAADRPLEEVLHLVDRATRELVTGLAEPPVAHRGVSGPTVGYKLIRRDGTEFAVQLSALPVRDHAGQVTGATIVLRDTTAAHDLSVRMSHLASHDALTDLPNRVLMRDRLERALAMASRHDRQLAVLYLDIDHFKHINDSLGHALGDQLLQSIGRDMTRCVRSSDTVSRQGGDEFVIVLAELSHAEDAAVGARHIIDVLTRPRMLEGHQLHITVSIGISVYPDDGVDADTLLNHADVALLHGKEQGRNCFQFFEPGLNRRTRERQEIETNLHGALERQEFSLDYQPKLNLQTGAMVGAEALIRWRQPGRGIVEPGQFVSIAEDCGLIRPIGRWVVHEACRQARAWQDAGLRPTAVAVNVSGIEFRNKDFVANVIATLAETRLDARYLEIELTESVLMTDVDATTVVLRALKNAGVRIAIDDFGTGWSSLSYLRQFPVDVLKIDKSFVHEITSRASVAPIVRAVIGMAKALKHRVIAEGVETLDQLAFLREENCDEAQGFLLGRPAAASQFASRLEPVHSRS